MRRAGLFVLLIGLIGLSPAVAQRDKGKDGPKPPAKKAEPPVAANLRSIGAVIEKDGDKIVGVDLSGVALNATSLTGIDALKDLRRLDLSGTGLTDAGLAPI